MLPRLSRRQQAGIAVAFALLLWMPQGISTHQHTMVTGHSTFYNGTIYDQCMASIAGILRSRVMWFNDMVLAERYAGRGTFVYITENGSKDPTENTVLYSEGVFYDFVDPNGAHWHVDEAFMYEGSTVDQQGDPINGAIRGDNVAVRYGQNRTYVWIVELAASPIHDQFAGTDPRYFHDVYNFLVMVDTCKMRKTAYHGNETHDTAEELGTDRGHAAGDGAKPHEHETYLANIWVGKRPNLLPVGGSADGLEWQSSWTVGYASDREARAEGASAQAGGARNEAEETQEFADGTAGGASP